MIKVNSYYTAQGSKIHKAVVFLHGFLENETIWHPLMHALSADYYTLAIDLLGHGRTPTVAEVHPMELMAEAVVEVLNKEGIDKATFVGHSMGGYVTLALAELYPERVEGVVLLNSNTGADSQEKKANRDRVLKVIDKEKELFVRTAVTGLFSEENRVRMKDALERLVSIGIATPNEGIKAAAMGMKERPDRTELFVNLAVKKHLIIGQRDALMPYTDLIKLADSAGASYSLLSGGHLTYIENEAECAEALKKFLS